MWITLKGILFFKDMEAVQSYVDKEKEYSKPVIISFLGVDYYSSFKIEAVDLIISQYAGFVVRPVRNI